MPGIKKTVICSFQSENLQANSELLHINSEFTSISVCISDGSSGSFIRKNGENFKICILLNRGLPVNHFYLSIESGGFITAVLNDRLIGFDYFPNTKAIDVNLSKSVIVGYISVIDDVIDFAARLRLSAGRAYPILQYKNMIITSEEYNFRDPSEILEFKDRYYLYFTATPKEELDGFRGEIWCSSCSKTDNPAVADNWAKPFKVIGHGCVDKDHDGTGCFTPDCYYDGRNVFVFYTALNSTHPKGLPQWSSIKEPEHILVAKSTQPDGGFVKTAKGADIRVSRRLSYSQATVPGGHTDIDGRDIRDNSLIDHGQCWVADSGERRYYYKGGQADIGGRVFLIRNLDENWLNGQRYGKPIIDEGKHMEGILICRVDNTLFMQLALIRENTKWRTYVSAADDGINWELIDEGYEPKQGEDYPMSIGYNRTVCPQWAVGQFPYDDGKQVGIGFLNVI